MSEIYLLGTANAVAQITHVTPANVEVDDVFEITLSNDAGESYEITFTATAATVQNVVEGLKAAADAAKAAGSDPWDDVTATEDDTKLIVTASTAGMPFTTVTSTTDGGGNDTQTLVASVSTANSGPNDWNTAANWSSGAVPVNADNVYLEHNSVSILYGLDQSAVSLGKLVISQSYEGKLGQGVLGAGYLQIGTSALNIGEYYGSDSVDGSERIKIDLKAVACTAVIHDSATDPAEAGLPNVRLKANNAATDIHIRKGRVGIACEIPSETSTINDVHVSYVNSLNEDAWVIIDEGVTMGELKTEGGRTTLIAAATTVTARAGFLTIEGTGTITTLQNEGATVYPNSTGTITTANFYGGTTDFTKSTRARTVTTPKIRPGATVNFDPDVVTMTNNWNADEPVTLQAT